MMRQIEFNFWTDLFRCPGTQVSSNVIMEMTDDELASFAEAIEPAKATRDMVTYFDEHLDSDLAAKIKKAISDSFNEMSAEEAINEMGIEMFEDMTEEEYDEHSMDELVEILMRNTELEELDFTVVDIEIVKQ